MDTENSESLSLEDLPADRRIIDELWSQKLISPEMKERALALIYPHRNWLLWISRIFLVLGITFFLSAIIYFFAFNWHKITPMMKLFSIQLALAVVIISTIFYGLERLAGKLLLLGAVVLIGVFLAVFGQIYQTGANAYQLFFTWSLLALPWVVISEFASLWMLWLVISNVALLLYGDQMTFLQDPTEMMIYSYLILFNTFLLMVKEVATKRGMVWLDKTWIRIIPLLFILIYTLFPISQYIQEPQEANLAIMIGVGLSVILYPAFYFIYRFRVPSIGALALTLLSTSIIAMEILWKILHTIGKDTVYESLFYLLMGFGTLAIFTGTVILLRNIDRKMKRSL